MRNDVINDRALELQRQLKGINFNETLLRSLPTLKFAETMKELQLNWNRQFKGIDLSGILEANLSLARALEPIKQYPNTWHRQLVGINYNISREMSFPILKLAETMKELQINWSRQFNNIDLSNFVGLKLSTSRLVESMKQYQSIWYSQISEIDFSNIKINENGTIDYFNETILEEDDMDEINSFINSKVSWEQKVVDIVDNLKFKHPVVTFIIIMLLVAPMYEYYIDCAKGLISNTIQQVQSGNKVNNDKNKIIKDIKKGVTKKSFINSSNDENLKMALTEYRIVKVEYLNIRESNSTNSKVLFKLELGQVVRVIEKNKDWVLVDYSDNENVYIKGWVFSKYISKLQIN